MPIGFRAPYIREWKKWILQFRLIGLRQGKTRWKVLFSLRVLGLRAQGMENKTVNPKT